MGTISSGPKNSQSYLKDETQTYTDAILKPKPQAGYKGVATLIPKVTQNETIANNYESIKYDTNTISGEGNIYRTTRNKLADK